MRLGCGALSGLGAEIAYLGGTRVLVVTDPGLLAAGVAGRVVDVLQQTAVEVAVFSDVSPNPLDTECELGAIAGAELHADLVLGLGGGSPMDTAKTIAGLLTNGGGACDYVGHDKFSKPTVPLVCVPTTAGTGSEVTRVAVITDSRAHVKRALVDSRILPSASVVDPELMVSLPPGLTAATGMDALTHAVEAFTSLEATPVTDALALEATALICGSLRAAVADGSDLEARTAMALGSVMAGYAFGNADVGGVHCMAEAVGGLYDTPHGDANAAFLALVTEFNASADLEKHARLASALGVDTTDMWPADAAAAGVQAIRDLAADVGTPAFRELRGVDDPDFGELARLAAAHVSAGSNPRVAGEAEYKELFQKAWSA
jgi:alcohol dehydrogenase